MQKQIVVEDHPEVENEHNYFPHSSYLLKHINQGLVLSFDPHCLVRKLKLNFAIHRWLWRAYNPVEK